MLEAVAVWTTLTIQWDVRWEWSSRRETGLRERFVEGPVHGAADDTAVKVLDPNVSIPPPTRVILMLRDPQQVAASAVKIGQLLTAEQVTSRVDAFRVRWRPVIDEVHVTELNRPAALFARLAQSGWPTAPPCTVMQTRAAR